MLKRTAIISNEEIYINRPINLTMYDAVGNVIFNQLVSGHCNINTIFGATYMEAPPNVQFLVDDQIVISRYIPLLQYIAPNQMVLKVCVRMITGHCNPVWERKTNGAEIPAGQ
ncbi:hypothetical protein H4219_006059 [Mycoemilia scoparia]|uniref:Uncharacterized protein n=1 Tax=Mycoemilia scoparia TaxID=417184 RepID=A0A9W7ZK38_9FUNG|nr:hypothetical protein H4219_006059 [Mycoemilia scoparia]